MTVEEHFSKLQQEFFKIKKEFELLKFKQVALEGKLQKDVKDMRTEAEKVLEKVSALVNPYSTKTMSYDKKS